MHEQSLPSERWPSPSMLCLVVIAGIGLYVGIRPIDDVDVFWQVLIGRSIIERGFDATEFISYHNPDAAMSWVGWLGQVVFAAMHRLGGWEAVQALHVFCYAAAFALAARRARLRGLAGGSVAFGLAILFVASGTNCAVRPQTFAFLAFSMLLMMLDRPGGAMRSRIAMLLLLVVWQNLHPSVAVAVGVCGAAAAGAWLDWRTTRSSLPRDDARHASSDFRRIAACSAVAAVAVFATPETWHILEISSRNSRLSTWLGISEWQPPHTIPDATAGFWLALGTVLLLAARRPRAIRWRDALPVALLTVASLFWSRMIVFWALSAVPATAALVDANLTASRPRQENDHHAAGRAGRLTAYACALAIALLLPASIPWLRQRASISPTWCRSLFDNRYPLDGVALLREALPTGRIYCYREWAGMIAFYGAPDWRVSIDGRIYRYDQSRWHRYASVAAGVVPYGPIFDAEQPDAVFLRPGHDDRLIDNLADDPSWHSPYHDANCHIFLPAKSGANISPATD